MMIFKPDQVKLLADTDRGIVETVDSFHSIRVRYAATIWKAKLYQNTEPVTLAPGQVVQVIGIQGITLLIAPE